MKSYSSSAGTSRLDGVRVCAVDGGDRPVGAGAGGQGEGVLVVRIPGRMRNLIQEQKVHPIPFPNGNCRGLSNLGFLVNFKGLGLI